MAVLYSTDKSWGLTPTNYLPYKGAGHPHAEIVVVADSAGQAVDSLLVMWDGPVF
ncbi:hypothetical protein [Mobiluncus curtisii]|uniref:hypothetical protein n=1 Tax=Mobiluncus curtisii TaxID=2051 RepID=UPI0014704FEE|nr:hypothetical protein [Mobiluncus curtisii]NMW49005.1 hypothetical protein [Mobiluncus curtisii]NMX12721.1 hypothetical protein [Mobiluncus curtisii]